MTLKQIHTFPNTISILSTFGEASVLLMHVQVTNLTDSDSFQVPNHTNRPAGYKTKLASVLVLHIHYIRHLKKINRIMQTKGEKRAAKKHVLLKFEMQKKSVKQLNHIENAYDDALSNRQASQPLTATQCPITPTDVHNFRQRKCYIRKCRVKEPVATIHKPI